MLDQRIVFINLSHLLMTWSRKKTRIKSLRHNPMLSTFYNHLTT